MSRIRTQEEFIAKAKEVHDDKYDYSQVEYVKTSLPVTIICPTHGPFQQRPQCHLRGQGCKLCGRERTRIGVDEFIRRAREVHGDAYDYSRVEFVSVAKKVCIVCPIHGEFWQTPNCHVDQGQRCPKCGHAAAGAKRTGKNNCMANPENVRKAQETCMAKYGAKTYAESAEGRQKLHDIITDPELQARSRQTCLDRYGAEVWTKSVVGRQRLHEIMASSDMRERVRQGYLRAYGVDHFMKTEDGRSGAREHMMSPERQEAIRQSLLSTYGVERPIDVPEFRDKMRAGLLAKYGCYSAFASRDIQVKSWATKSQNGTFNQSAPEEALYELLCVKFGQNDVKREYVDLERYPFHCDFYIVSIDTFVELNAFWMHNGHWFNENDDDDIAVRDMWEDKSEGEHGAAYAQALYTWTVRDVLKHNTAVQNGLNYQVFWRCDLADAKAWLEFL